MRRPPYYTNYSRSRLLIHNVVTSKYFDLAIAAVIGLNVVTMAMEFYLMPPVSHLGFELSNLKKQTEQDVRSSDSSLEEAIPSSSISLIIFYDIAT